MNAAMPNLTLIDRCRRWFEGWLLRRKRDARESMLWEIFRRARRRAWSRACGDFVVHATEFIPHDTKGEVYVFFSTDAELAHASSSGLQAQMQRAFAEEFAALLGGAVDEYPLVFVFDSHENVERNYKGSYYLRML
jgi:hypothetical protein